jgi:hypothetical protein
MTMALTAEIDLRMAAVGLTDLFEEQIQLYRAMAVTAYEYAEGYVEDAGLPLRIDDVAVALEPALHLSEPLTTLLGTKRLTQKYWYRYFADLILDRLWKELSGDTVPEKG